jgi:hypothetical protein
MLALRYLLAVVAAVAATAAAAVAVSNAFRSSQAPLVSAAASIIAGEAAHLDTPVPVRQYLAYYYYAGGRWILANSTGIPVYVLGLGQCPQSIASLLGRTYAQSNATVVLTDCVLIMPWAQGNTVTSYAATCRSGTDFRPEAAEVEASGVEVRLVLVNC